MIKKITQITFLFISLSSYAQNVGINATGATPDASAMLDIVSTDRGLLVPRVTLASTTDASTINGTEANGLLVYNTTAAGAGATAVLANTFYYWDLAQTKWIAFTGSGGRDWALLGNGGTTAGTNFLGTTDATDVVFKTNSTEIYRMGNTNKNVMVNATTNSADFLSSTANNTLNAVGAYVAGTNAAKGVYAYSTSSNAAANAVYAEATSTGPSALYAKLNNATSTKAAIEADANSAPKGNAIYAFNTGDVGYSAIYALTTPNAAGTSYASSLSNHTIYALMNGTSNYSFGLMGRINSTPNLSAGTIGLYSDTQWGALGYRESAALVYGVFGNAGSAGTNIAGHFKASGGTSNIALRLSGATSGTLDISPAATTTSYALTMPNAQSTANTNMTFMNDGTGALTWANLYGANIQSDVELTDRNLVNATTTTYPGLSVTFTAKHTVAYLSYGLSGASDLGGSSTGGWVTAQLYSGASGISSTGSASGIVRATHSVDGEFAAFGLGINMVPFTTTPGTTYTITLKYYADVPTGDIFYVYPTTYPSFSHATITVFD